MALQKSFTRPDGFECPQAYYRLQELHLDFENKRASIVFSGYKDATTATSAKTDKLIRPAHVVPIELTNGDFVFKKDKSENVVALAYTKAKTKEQFQGAVDVL